MPPRTRARPLGGDLPKRVTVALQRLPGAVEGLFEAQESTTIPAAQLNKLLEDIAAVDAHINTLAFTAWRPAAVAILGTDGVGLALVRMLVLFARRDWSAEPQRNALGHKAATKAAELAELLVMALIPGEGPVDADTHADLAPFLHALLRAQTLQAAARSLAVAVAAWDKVIPAGPPAAGPSAAGPAAPAGNAKQMGQRIFDSAHMMLKIFSALASYVYQQKDAKLAAELLAAVRESCLLEHACRLLLILMAERPPLGRHAVAAAMSDWKPSVSILSIGTNLPVQLRDLAELVEGKAAGAPRLASPLPRSPPSATATAPAAVLGSAAASGPATAAQGAAGSPPVAGPSRAPSAAAAAGAAGGDAAALGPYACGGWTCAAAISLGVACLSGADELSTHGLRAGLLDSLPSETDRTLSYSTLHGLPYIGLVIALGVDRLGPRPCLDPSAADRLLLRLGWLGVASLFVAGGGVERKEAGVQEHIIGLESAGGSYKFLRPEDAAFVGFRALGALLDSAGSRAGGVGEGQRGGRSGAGRGASAVDRWRIAAGLLAYARPGTAAALKEACAPLDRILRELDHPQAGHGSGRQTNSHSPSAPPALAAALEGGWLRALERMLRRAGEDPEGPEAKLAARIAIGPAQARLSSGPACASWLGPMLAHAGPRPAASFAATLTKLLMRLPSLDPIFFKETATPAALLYGNCVTALAAGVGPWLPPVASDAAGADTGAQSKACEAGAEKSGGAGGEELQAWAFAAVQLLPQIVRLLRQCGATQPEDSKGAAAGWAAVGCTTLLASWLPWIRAVAAAAAAVTEQAGTSSGAAGSEAAWEWQSFLDLDLNVTFLMDSTLRAVKVLGRGPPPLEQAQGQGQGQRQRQRQGQGPGLGLGLGPAVLVSLADTCCAVAAALPGVVLGNPWLLGPADASFEPDDEASSDSPFGPQAPDEPLWSAEDLAALASELDACGGQAAAAAAAGRVRALAAALHPPGGGLPTRASVAALAALGAACRREEEQGLARSGMGPSEALALLPGCGNPACVNLAGDSEEGCKLQRCGRCGRVSYCCRECQRAHWSQGHKGVCGVESLTPEAKAAVVGAIGAMLEERGRDELVDLMDLKRCLEAQGTSISAPALAAYLQWMATYREQEMAKGNCMPDIIYDEDTKMFAFM